MSEAPRRLFFALWPDVETRVRLDKVASALHDTWGGRKVNNADLHLTLAFLGETPANRVDALRQIATTIVSQPFTLMLNHLGCWPHNHVGWLGLDATPLALAQLVTDLRRVLYADQFAVDDQPYVPHVTLLRNARCSVPPPCRRVSWYASSFVLLVSRANGVGGYDVLDEWQLLPLTAE